MLMVGESSGAVNALRAAAVDRRPAPGGMTRASWSISNLADHPPSG